jgi:hypothetical protein
MPEALQIAAQCWCDDETSSIVMDHRLAEAMARRIAAWMETGALHAQNETYWKARAESAEAERERLRLDIAAKQQQINAFYLGTPEARLLAMTKERDRLRDALIACRPAVSVHLYNFRMARAEKGIDQAQALLDTIDAAAKGLG